MIGASPTLTRCAPKPQRIVRPRAWAFAVAAMAARKSAAPRTAGSPARKSATPDPGRYGVASSPIFTLL
jgi:hypothetical protein